MGQTARTSPLISLRGGRSTNTKRSAKRLVLSLNQILPSGWESFITARTSRSLWCKCEICGYKPPDQLRYYSQRWRDLFVHERMKHSAAGKRPQGNA